MWVIICSDRDWGETFEGQDVRSVRTEPFLSRQIHSQQVFSKKEADEGISTPLHSLS